MDFSFGRDERAIFLNDLCRDLGCEAGGSDRILMLQIVSQKCAIEAVAGAGGVDDLGDLDRRDEGLIGIIADGRALGAVLDDDHPGSVLPVTADGGGNRIVAEMHGFIIEARHDERCGARTFRNHGVHGVEAGPQARAQVRIEGDQLAGSLGATQFCEQREGVFTRQYRQRDA